MRHLEAYNQQISNLDDFKRNSMNSIVSIIKTIITKPLHIGNHWFYYVEYKGREVPAYCHQRDYKEENPKFLPIYDEDNMGEFGWSDFKECCRIFDLIENKIFGKEIKR